jgi:hypothetical protein
MITYEKALQFTGILSEKPRQALREAMAEKGMKLKPLPSAILETGEYGPQVTKHFSRLDLHIAEGPPSWQGLVVGFPGTSDQLSTVNVGTPYLRKILYPMLETHRRVEAHLASRTPCLYLLGSRFRDVFLRKFRLLDQVVPHVIILTQDLLHCACSNSNPFALSGTSGPEAELQKSLCETMNKSHSGLAIPVAGRSIRVGFLAFEVPTSEGTKNPERLDILGYDIDDHSLVAVEIKAEGCGRVDLENLFLQGMEHRNWLEENKMAVKLLFEGPRGSKINTRKRVRLVLGWGTDQVPKLFKSLREAALGKDRYLRIDFVQVADKPDSSGQLLKALGDS